MTPSNFDEDLNYIGPPATPEDRQRATQLYREGMHRYYGNSDRVEYGANRHHSEYIRLKSFEALYHAGLLRRDQLPRDCDSFETFNLFRTARDCLTLAGVTPPPANKRAETITRALGSSDFSSLLSNTMNQAMTLGYQSADTTWQLFTVTKPVPDFKSFEALRGASMSMPPAAEENAEVEAGQLLDEGSESGAIKTYRERITLSRQSLINGDIERLTLTPFAAGQAVSRRINSEVYSLLTSNPTLSDGIATFHASHGNLIASGSGAAPSVTTLDECATTMAGQVNAASEPLNLRPRIILGPPGMASTLAILRNSINSADPADPSTGRLVTVTDAALSGSAWYAFASPQRQPGIAVVTLAGSEDQPRLEELTKAPIGAPDGRHFIVGHDFTVVVVNHKALFRNDGA